MSPPSKSALSYRRVSLAIALSLATVIFHTILCILLSYSILDLISPHSRINAGRHDRVNTNSTANTLTPIVFNLTSVPPASNTTAAVVPTNSTLKNSTSSTITLENARANAPNPNTNSSSEGASLLNQGTNPPHLSTSPPNPTTPDPSLIDDSNDSNVSD
ncbi:hypothetical protein PCANC_03088 [Puccinia coronata f. sp. avenae]|uniref:Uncharacterized protein n=1 Tax=Puccinia coronata f. sp. avenae TaxID=200324 RepID=A0A2N5W4L7_9BASI|nr:hypothetical protein PCANC_07337 [Puccinia coronata f. sp. avenae]PLW57208.1 hypothetical protein PCANC_03088 [Puccinia coronata f. sp. avenae]